ncbi:amidase [Acuticoccus mangrovi]|uniref:Amidase n=1 Tax=Acuticoccus mangrovi TaxID=2796142 RepID=A0A934IUU2_9HYPH|nr:amidase [Acuticoccus mangrovi]MBJ3778134.1 amidase [Acuticoccus mangrovi]
MSTLTDLGAAEAARKVRAGTVSPVALVEAHLERIGEVNGTINAVVTLTAEAALDTARRLEARIAAGEPVGPLAGVTVGVKDVTPVAGVRTTFGSPLFADHVPTTSALVVERLLAADAILIGKTNTPEFAAGANTVNRVFGATVNPHDTALSAGGSTGGGAAGIASGMFALAEGTDFGGSLRVPAAFCGVMGLRPTAGLVPSHPVPDPWDMGRVHGAIARSADDLTLALSVMAGPSTASAVSAPLPWADLGAAIAAIDPAGLRLGVTADLAGIGLDPGPRTAFAAALERLAGAGLEIAHEGFTVPQSRAAYRVIRGFWMATQYASLSGQEDKLGPALAGNIAAGRALGAEDLAAACATRAALWHRWRALFETVDVLLTPTVPCDPFPIEQNYPSEIDDHRLDDYVDWIAPTYAVTLMGFPAISVPFGRTPKGLPFGLQLIAPRFGEPQLLALAAHLAAL